MTTVYTLVSWLAILGYWLLIAGNWLQQSADTKYCPSSVAVVRPPLQELCSTAYIPRSANPVTFGKRVGSS